MVVNPLEGAFAFTLVLGITIFVQGVIQVSLAFQMRRISPSWGWMLVSGMIGIIFGIFVWSSTPLTVAWLSVIKSAQLLDNQRIRLKGVIHQYSQHSIEASNGYSSTSNDAARRATQR